MQGSTTDTTFRDERILSPDVCVLRHVLDRTSAATPDKVFVRFNDGHEWTYAQLHSIVRRTAAALQRMGIAQSDHVLTWLEKPL